ncbi:hypothetical protein FRC03_007444 [Tulasnella sp. 419]|nr:hypothetical protein FRC03_007444 [Tulasnella sp. 419]
MIIEKEQQEDSDYQSDQELLDELMGFVFAGHDTTPAVCSFGLKLLTNHPEVQKKLRTELLSNLNEPENRNITYEDVGTGEKTPYLEAVVHEVLRCADVTITARQPLEDITILGKHIPKGTEILFLTGMASRRATASYVARRQDVIAGDFKPTKGAWADEGVDEFKPERWLVDGTDGKKVFSASQGYSMPFGLGSRACFGIKLALLELRMIIATINLGGFLDKVPEELNNFEGYEEITLKPKQAYVSFVDWEDIRD